MSDVCLNEDRLHETCEIEKEGHEIHDIIFVEYAKEE